MEPRGPFLYLEDVLADRMVFVVKDFMGAFLSGQAYGMNRSNPLTKLSE